MAGLALAAISLRRILPGEEALEHTVLGRADEFNLDAQKLLRLRWYFNRVCAIAKAGSDSHEVRPTRFIQDDLAQCRFDMAFWSLETVLPV